MEGAAVIHLAMMQLNTGDGSIIPEVQGLNETCDLRFTFEAFDTENYQTTVVNDLIDLMAREPNRTSESLPCAFLGPGRSALSLSMAVYTGVLGYPQMSGISTSSQLDDRSQYRYFSRLVPSDDGTAWAVIMYMRDVVRINHLAVIHSNNAYGNAFLASLQKAATQFAPTMNIQSIKIPINIITDQDLQTAVTFLKNTEFRYIFAIIDGVKAYERLLTEAYHKGITGDDYVWIYSDSLQPQTITDRVYEGPDDPLAVAARGSSILMVRWGLPGTPAYDKLVSTIQEFQNYPDHLEFLQSKHPVYEGEPDYEPLPVERIFQSQDPGPNAVFLYDSTIAMGLAACAVANPPSYFDGQAHYERILNSRFIGASGPISIDPTTGSRDPASAYFQVLNFVESRNPTSGNITFDMVQTDIFRDGAWQSVKPYIYGDGTTNVPHSLPMVEVNNNYISGGLRATGFALSALVVILSIGFALWTVLRRQKKSKVVIASQPIFLHLICAGVLLMGSAIIPLSIDDEIVSVRGCDIACMTTPWLFVLGFALSFAALFSKTWRINKIFHNPSLKRMKISAFDVMRPLAALLVVNVLVLSLWSGLNPLKWEREVTRVDVFGQTVEREGRCESGSFAAYVSVLAVVNMGALLVAAYQAYCARDIAVEFSESSYIGKAIGLFLLACLYGIPVLAITWDDPSARYFVLLILDFVCSFSVLLLIFVPKVIFDRRGGFKRAGQIVAKHTMRHHSEVSSGGSGTFVSGIPSTAGDSSTGRDWNHDSDHEGMGVRVIDNGRLREDLKRHNKELREEHNKLQKRLHKLEKTVSQRNLTQGLSPERDEKSELSFIPEEKAPEEPDANEPSMQVVEDVETGLSVEEKKTDSL